MEHILARTQLCIKRDGRRVALIRLDEDDMRAEAARNRLERLDQRGGHALAAVRGADGEIVDVDLAALLFELGERIGAERAG